MIKGNRASIYEFAMGFIASSDNYKRQFTEPWREILSNFMVQPVYEQRRSEISPYRQGRVYSSRNNQIILKDPETHKVIMTYASKLVRSLFGERNRAYIKATPRGYEDAPRKAPTVSRLLRYSMSLQGTFRTLVEAIVDMLLFGTSVIEVSWSYQEREMPVRSIDSELGVDTDTFTRLSIPIYDDPKLTPVDIVDFYPDPTHYRIADMCGAAKRFRMNAYEAKDKRNGGIYDSDAVQEAISNLGKQTNPTKTENFRSGIDQPQMKEGPPGFKEMIGYEYWGDVPEELGIKDDNGAIVSRGVITILNNVVVQAKPWPTTDPHLPWHTFVINPVQGRFYGISPAEVIRYDQDFADALKILLAQAVIRQVHPPIAFDPDSEIDVTALKAWKADALIAARGGPASVGVLRYDANAANGFNMLAMLKGSMQEASGAQGGIQGEAGPDREAASVGVQRIQMALDRPELAAMLIENECLPPIGEAILRLNQQFLDAQGLRDRIGELPDGGWIGDIMGDFDVEFVGSRMAMSRQEKLQAFDRLVGMSTAMPALAARLPLDQIGEWLIGELLELPEIAAQMGNPQQTLQNMLMMQALGPGAGKNQVPSRPEPAGMLPAQASGASP